jgi:hypothetical protein
MMNLFSTVLGGMEGGEEGYITRQVQRRGGPVFFELSLLIFLVLLYSLLS